MFGEVYSQNRLDEDVGAYFTISMPLVITPPAATAAKPSR